MIYLVILFLLLILSIHYDICEKTRNRVFWESLILLIFVLLAGLRWRLGIDTTRYLDTYYHDLPTIDKFSFEDYPLMRSPLYYLLCSLVKTVGGRYYIIQIIESLFVNTLIFKYIKKHSSYFFTCLLFYFLIYYTIYNMETMRASFGIAICLFGNDYIKDRKWLKGYLLYLVAFLFHYQFLILLLLPLLSFIKLDFKGIIILFAALVVGYIASVRLGDYIQLFEINEKMSEKATQYGESDDFGARELSLWSIILVKVPPIFMLVWAILYVKRNNHSSDFAKIESFAMFGLIFSMIQFSIQIIYRFVEIYAIYFVLYYAEFFCSLAKSQKLSRSLALSRSIILFIPLFYSVALNNLRSNFRYYPYSSVIERRIDKNRELRYKQEEQTPSANINEY